ncbi:FAD-dependent oxidoreductase [Candidatus Micrarchaeota archaeon]|nr:FAD-dependent oxidoreductase [Candidatus Micrarchaeota archaeon]
MRIVVLGAGITGLSAAWKLAEAGNEVTVVEKNKQVGGLSASFKYKDYTLDYGPHKIYTQIIPVLDEIKKLLGEDLLAHPKKCSVRLKGKNLDYPVRVGQVLTKLSPSVTIPCGFSFLSSLVSKKPDASYEDYIKNRFGAATYELVFRDLAEKVWGNPKELDAALAKARLSAPGMMELLKRSLLGDKGKEEIHAKTFYYPKKGMQQLGDKMKEKIENSKGRVLFDLKPTKLETKENRITEVKFSYGALPTDYVVSTISLEEVPSLLGLERAVPAASQLTYRSLILLYVVVKRPRIFEESFIFYPEKEFLFNRLSEQKAFSEETIPKDKTVLCAEITCSPEDALFHMNDADLFERALLGMNKAFGLKREEVEEYFTRRSESVYPVYSKGF